MFKLKGEQSVTIETDYLFTSIWDQGLGAKYGPEVAQWVAMDIAYLETNYHFFHASKTLGAISVAVQNYADGKGKDSREHRFATRLVKSVDALKANVDWIVSSWGRDLDSLYDSLADRHELDRDALEAWAELHFGDYPSNIHENFGKLVETNIGEIASERKVTLIAAIIELYGKLTDIELEVVKDTPLFKLIDNYIGLQSKEEIGVLLLDYVQKTKPFTKLCEQAKKGCTKPSKVFLQTLEDLPNFIEYKSENKEYVVDLGGYLEATVPKLQKAFTNSRWSLYLAVSQTYGLFSRSDSECETDDDLACADGVVPYYQDKIGVRYNVWERGGIFAAWNANLYLSGYLYRIEPRASDDFSGRFQQSRIIGLDILSFYIYEIFDLDIGIQQIDPPGEKPINVFTIGLSIPLTEYLADLAGQ